MQRYLVGRILQAIVSMLVVSMVVLYSPAHCDPLSPPRPRGHPKKTSP